MKTTRAPVLLLGVLYLAFAIALVASAPLLPGRMATHFDGLGRPDGWMGRGAHLAAMAGLGLVLPLCLVGAFAFARFLPDGSINLPHRDYWLAPERRAETFDYLRRQSYWFACMALAFVIGLHLLVVLANREPRPRLSTPLILGLAGGFLAGVVAWTVGLIAHFARRPRA